MVRNQNPNIEILLLAVTQLGELADEMVFLGGCATGLLISDKAAPPIRVTKDVDAIVQVVTKSEYYRLSEDLRTHGFHEDMSDDAPVCRWISDNVILDVMPTEPEILGFGNKWYEPAMANASLIQLDGNRRIRMVSAPYFLITKLEAFDGRGSGDYLVSHDIEDIIAVIDGRPDLIEEVKQSESKLVKELVGRFKYLLQERRFIEAISGHMPADEASQARVPIVLKRIEKITGLR